MAKEKQDNSKKRKTSLQEGVHYYIEDGLYVFTELYLKERGYCCGSGCRHCPYGFKEIDPKQED